MGERSTRKKSTAEQKAAILRRHLQDKVPVSDLCDEYKIRPSVLYTWQRHLLENIASVMDHGKTRQARAPGES